MLIEFEIAGKPVEYRRNWLTGRASVRSSTRSYRLQSPWQPGTHYSFTLTRTWRVEVDGHDVVIEKVRPLLFAGFRPHAYRLYIDQALVAEKKGY